MYDLEKGKLLKYDLGNLANNNSPIQIDKLKSNSEFQQLLVQKLRGVMPVDWWVKFCILDSTPHGYSVICCNTKCFDCAVSA